LALVLVLGLGLAIGVQRGGDRHESLEQRTLAIAGEVRCPVCSGESAAGSDTVASLQIRQAIRTDLAHGETKGQILEALQRSYGAGILESPPTSGITLWAWLIPVVIIAAGVLGLALGFRHWRRGRLVPDVSPGPPVVAAAAGAGVAGAGPVVAGAGQRTGARVAAEDEALVREALAHRRGPGQERP
jgi:cytochrome c-type biogenesis protein CcmH